MLEYHSDVQDVAPRDAGLILGLTNTCSSLAGVAGNLAAGHLADSAYGFGGSFWTLVGVSVVRNFISDMAGICKRPANKLDILIEKDLTYRNH